MFFLQISLSLLLMKGFMLFVFFVLGTVAFPFPMSSYERATALTDTRIFDQFNLFEFTFYYNPEGYYETFVGSKFNTEPFSLGTGVYFDYAGVDDIDSSGNTVNSLVYSKKGLVASVLFSVDRFIKLYASSFLYRKDIAEYVFYGVDFGAGALFNFESAGSKLLILAKDLTAVSTSGKSKGGSVSVSIMKDFYLTKYVMFTPMAGTDFQEGRGAFKFSFITPSGDFYAVGGVRISSAGYLIGAGLGVENLKVETSNPIGLDLFSAFSGIGTVVSATLIVQI